MIDPLTTSLTTVADITLQTYGLVFLLGSLTVASLSDLRRLAAQKDFAEVWGLRTSPRKRLIQGLFWICPVSLVGMTAKYNRLRSNML